MVLEATTIMRITIIITTLEIELLLTIRINLLEEVRKATRWEERRIDKFMDDLRCIPINIFLEKIIKIIFLVLCAFDICYLIFRF